MRARYLRAVLRQDMEFFDLRAGLASEVVASLSSDSLAVQDVLSERVPNLVANATMFVGSYAVAFEQVWRLALAALPSALLLVVPGVLCGRVLTGLARRIRERYARAGAVAEQAVSSVRTVYSFAAETSAVARFSAALDEPARLRLRRARQGRRRRQQRRHLCRMGVHRLVRQQPRHVPRLPGRHCLRRLHCHYRRRHVRNPSFASSIIVRTKMVGSVN